MTTVTHLECSLCGKTHEAGQPHPRCACGGALLARYDLEKARQSWSRDWIANGPSSMWRYTPVLPVSKPNAIVSLGEGMTPLVRAQRIGASVGAENLWIKDEGINPTGALKARGLSCAISMCVELGITKVRIASAGNSASAVAAYAAAAGIDAHVAMPASVRQANYIECKAFGASDNPDSGFDLGTLQEPYRVEGEKTMGYEIAEQFRWGLPDAVLCPRVGVGLIGLWKAFAEMEELGWTSGPRPKLIAIESGAPLDPLTSRVIRESGGCEVRLSAAERLDAGVELARLEGIFAAPEGAACVAAVRKLIADGVLKPEERIVMCNTASGLKYLEAYSTRFPRMAGGEADKLGGLITPR